MQEKLSSLGIGSTCLGGLSQDADKRWGHRELFKPLSCIFNLSRTFPRDGHVIPHRIHIADICFAGLISISNATSSSPETVVENMVGKLEGKVAIITGGSSGFGLGMATKFLEEGAKVLIMDINADGARAAFANQSGIAYLQGDVSVREDWEAALAMTLKEFGKLDIVINNAGILIIKVGHLRRGTWIAADVGS